MDESQINTEDNTVENYTQPGMIIPLFGEPKFFSKRNIPLATQHLFDHWSEPVSMLTDENSEKWYEIYVIHSTGEVEAISDFEEYEFVDSTLFIQVD